MGSLSNLYISQSYISLIHLGSNNTASSTPVELQDGLGNGVGVSVSTNKNLYVSGNVYATNLTGSVIDSSSFVTTASFNAYTQSTNNTIATLATTQSVNNLSASIYQTDSTQSNNISTLTSKTGSYATTGSNTFVGNQTINGNISSSGNLTINSITASAAQITYLHTIYESSSVVYSSGSNQLGDELTDTQILSGSVKVVGGLTINGVNVSTQSYVDLTSLNNFTASQYVSNSYFATTSSVNTLSSSVYTQFSASTFFSGSQYKIDSSSFSSRINAITSSGGTISVQDEGTILGAATSFNFIGAGVTATLSSGTASVTIPGGGGSAVGVITTGSNGQEQSITGSLGLTTLNNVSAINTLFTASTAPTPMEGTSSAVYFVSYSSVPDGNPNAYSVQADGNWIVSGSGVNNQIITAVNGDDNGLLYEAGGATFTQGENYVFTAETFYNNLNFNNGIAQLQSDSGLNATFQAGNNAGDGSSPGFRAVVNSATNPGNIYGFHAIDDAGGDGSNNFGFSLNTYTSFGSGLVGVIYGGGYYNDTTDAIYFVSSSIRMLKPTTFNAPVTFNSSTSFSTPITASAIRLTGTGTTALQYNQPSTGSVNGVNATYYGKSDFRIYQYNSQPYAFNAYLQTNILNPYTGSEFQWGLETNGTNSIPGGGSTYFSLMSGSTVNGTGPGATKVGLKYLQTAQCMYFNADTSFARKVYINQGLMVSASAGSNTASVIIDTANPGGGKALEVTGSVIITGSLSVNGSNIAALGAGAFSSIVTQSGSANVSQSMQFTNTDVSQGVTLVSGSQLKVAAAGTYNIQFSAQSDRTAGSGTDTLYIWLKKNGNNVSNTATAVTISGGVLAAKTVPAWNFVVTANANDYFELVWQATDSSIQLTAIGASGNIPLIPSVIATVTQVR